VITVHRLAAPLITTALTFARRYTPASADGHLPIPCHGRQRLCDGKVATIVGAGDIVGTSGGRRDRRQWEPRLHLGDGRRQRHLRLRRRRRDQRWPGNDSIFGGDGNDVLYGNHGVDYLDGGAGIDRLHTFSISEGDAGYMMAGDGDDQIFIGSGTSYACGNGTDVKYESTPTGWSDPVLC